jgi:hypothetical protein
MSAVADRVLSIARPQAASRSCVWVPLLGGLWVVANVALGSLGIYADWPIRCAFAAGLINGTLLGIVAVATASARFQASATGLLGGLTLSALRSDGSMIWKATQGVHGMIDNTFRAMGIDVNEKLHDAIAQETLYMVWTMVFVVMASLVAEWVRASRAQTDEQAIRSDPSGFQPAV